MKKIIILLCLLGSVCFISGCLNQRSIVTPLTVNISNEPNKLTLVENEQVILYTLEKGKWNVESFGNNDIHASFQWRRHIAQIIIEMNKDYFIIKYGGSNHLNYRPSMWLWSDDMSINKKYNSLVDILCTQIHSNLFESNYVINLIKKHEKQIKEFKEKMNKFIGKDYNTLIMNMGPPENIYTTPSGIKVITYLKTIDKGATSLKGFFLGAGGSAFIKKDKDYYYYQYFYLNTNNIVTKWKEEIKER